MLNSPKISVIIPIYNQEKFLERCLDSLSAQTYSNIEFIMIDDGSTDSSGSICKSYCENDSRFIYVYQENSGVSAARNKGLDIAKGEYIGFCDSDDWVENDIYEILYDMIEHTGADAAVCGFIVENAENPECVESEETIISAEQAIRNMYEYNNDGGGYLWNKLINRNCIGDKRLDGSIALYEDMLFMYDVFGECDKIVCCNHRKYHYVYNTQSALHGKFNEREWSGQVAQKLLVEKISSDYPRIIAVAQKGCIALSMRLASRLTFAHILDKNNYKRLKGDIKPCVNKASMSLISPLRRLSVRLFLMNRSIYIMFRKIAFVFIKR